MLRAAATPLQPMSPLLVYFVCLTCVWSTAGSTLGPLSSASESAHGEKRRRAIRREVPAVTLHSGVRTPAAMAPVNSGSIVVDAAAALLHGVLPSVVRRISGAGDEAAAEHTQHSGAFHNGTAVLQLQATDNTSSVGVAQIDYPRSTQKASSSVLQQKDVSVDSDSIARSTLDNAPNSSSSAAISAVVPPPAVPPAAVPQSGDGTVTASGVSPTAVQPDVPPPARMAEAADSQSAPPGGRPVEEVFDSTKTSSHAQVAMKTSGGIASGSIKAHLSPEKWHSIGSMVIIFLIVSGCLLLMVRIASSSLFTSQGSDVGQRNRILFGRSPGESSEEEGARSHDASPRSQNGQAPSWRRKIYQKSLYMACRKGWRKDDTINDASAKDSDSQLSMPQSQPPTPPRPAGWRGIEH